MRIIETENFTRVLSQLPLGENPECVEIGANDGVGEEAKSSGKDYLYDFLMENREWRAPLIEPVPAVFDSLRTNYANRPERTAFLNCAISDRNGRRQIELNGGESFRTSQLVKNINEKKQELGGYIETPILTYQLACELMGFRDVKFLKIDAENHDHLILKTILNRPFLGKLPVIIQWEENNPFFRDSNISRLQKIGYFIVKTGLTKRGLYANRLAFHHSIVKNFTEYFSPRLGSKLTHPLGGKEEILLKSPKIIDDAENVNIAIKKLVTHQKLQIAEIINILNRHQLNYNTKFFIDEKLGASLIKKTQKLSKGYLIDLIQKPIRKNALVNDFFNYFRAVVYGDENLILWSILISPNTFIHYLRLSELFSPYKMDLENIQKKITYLERSFYAIVKNNPSYSAIHRKTWEQTILNHLPRERFIQKRYPFPLFSEEKLFGTDRVQEEEESRQKIYFLSTPSSGTQSLIFILSYLSKAQFHQYSYLRIMQEKNHLSDNLFTSIDAGVNIHSHLPLPESAVHTLLNAGYKIVVLKREASVALISGARHVARRPSYYPLDCSRDQIDYFREVTDFLSKFQDMIDLDIDYSQLKSSTEEVITAIDDKFFQSSPEYIQEVKQHYMNMIKNNRLNFRGGK